MGKGQTRGLLYLSIRNLFPAIGDIGLYRIIKDKGLELIGSIPEDEAVYEYDLNGRPTIEIPDDNVAVQAAFEIFDKIVK